ncbi:MAG: hypothetical protein LBH09_01670, partial [Peptococcaceae bacterium]|nr:hypothetical protein [Peptococcaceae bacterium]
MYKIALLTYPFLLAYFEESVAPFRGRCTIDVVPFEKQYDLLDMIPSLLEQYDGLCVFSSLVTKFIEQSHLDIPKPVVYLDRRSVDYFKTFFTLLSDNRNIDFSRVVLDTSLLRLDNVRSLENVRKNIVMFEDRRTEYLEDMGLNDFMALESTMEVNAMELWRSGRFDIIVCRFANMASLMERENIPYFFVYPEKHRITDALENLLNHIRLDKQTEGLPASI